MKQERIYARNTIVQEITIETVIDFINQYHKQGMPKQFSNEHSYGLYDKNTKQLIAVIVFTTPRTKRKRLEYKWELLRLCFKKNIRIPGGASKLIQYFIRDVEPVNFFTYQDTSGENSKVYELSGMTLKEKARDKKVLVKNGLTYNTAINNRRDWFSFQQASTLGPDKLLKTKIGQQYDKDNNRLTNIQLFTDYCDYHVETIPGDNTYDWHNDKYVYYTYKITASDSPKYYYGRKTHYKENNDYNENDLLNDNYYGSGGVKFNNWKKKHKNNLEKEIIQVYHHWGDSVKGEKELIGKSYKNDKNCLNSVAGGVGHSGGTHKREYKEKHCPVHGLTLHSRNICCKCLSDKNIKMKHCPTHGLTKFNGDNCCKCTTNKIYFQKECTVHGLTTFTKNGCCKCTNSNYVSFLSHCDKHGETYHYKNGQCMSCSQENIKNITIKHCPTHGDTQHKGGTCLKCTLEKVYDTTTCIIHGDSKHKNGYCLHCSNIKNGIIDIKECSQHGQIKHVDNYCFLCLLEDYPMVKKLFDSRIVRKNIKKDSFTCPYCSNTFSLTFNNVLINIIHNVNNMRNDNHKELLTTAPLMTNLCSSCEHYNSFLLRKDIQAAQLFLNDWDSIEPPIRSVNDKRVFLFKCPQCGDEKKFKFVSFIKQSQKYKVYCRNCDYKV